MSDPEFPVGGVDVVGGRWLPSGYVSKILYVETKESGPLGGMHRASPLDPLMLTVHLAVQFQLGVYSQPPLVWPSLIWSIPLRVNSQWASALEFACFSFDVLLD